MSATNEISIVTSADDYDDNSNDINIIIIIFW
jgi:hypothetical protein